ncbi:trichodiene oxygenase [Daldinia vernicosa]|uniref:trichodiene oxygenase n=1 Tax=Daldinia vernicosa TaxID=114800 RepID=UPI002007A4D3|nr:trichodiene oxygenase [Daldinia vernicosa]KAI0849536.1 trichodiene oxygenase [Daldinia vernicosa]
MFDSITNMERNQSYAWWIASAVPIVFFLIKCFYNLYLHPLSRFPGPKLAAIGSYYEFWFDVIKDGQYLWEIARMHEIYGPIVRISANQLHIRDSQFYNTIYSAGGRKINKDAGTVAIFAAPSSIVATVDHQQHKARRSYLQPYFSKHSILSMEPMIHERVGKLCERIEVAMNTTKEFDLSAAILAMTGDIITQRFYGEHSDFLSAPDFDNMLNRAILGLALNFHFTRSLPGLVSIIKKIPIPILSMVLPQVAEPLVWREKVKHDILSCLDEENKKESKSIIVSALGNENIPPADREINRLLDEGEIFLLAGAETTARAISVGMFYLLNDKTGLKKLRDELSTLPFQPENEYPMSQLERLPYLAGVVQESLRLSSPVGRLPRVSVDEPLQYHEYIIPRGTPVSQSAYFVHNDPEIYPNPDSFDPGRWIKAAEENFPLHKYLVNFTKGTRQCIGIPLVSAEIHITIARLVSTFDMDLYKTTMESVEIHHDRFVAYPKKSKDTGSWRGEIMVKVTGRARSEAAK